MVILWMLLILFIAALLVRTGIAWAEQRLANQQQALDSREAALDAEWQALENTRRVRSVFLDARRAMQREADSRAGRHVHAERLDGEPW